MATVFLARLQGAGGFQRLVAIKRLHSHLAEDPEFVEMFLAEARIAAQIHHTHAVPILEIGSSPSGFYLVMEYIEGVTLQQLNQRVWQTELPIPRRIALRIVLDALAGLNAAHELTDEMGKLLGIVHRDCSPQNIIVGVDGTARLTDFGVARATTRLSNTRAGTIKGKVSYMAPEQIKRGQLDRRADLFAMGVILWESLAGRSLFRSDTRIDTILKALNAPVPRLSEVTFGVPAALEEACAKALARAPEERFQTAVEMAEAIELAAAGAIASSREVASFLVKLFGRDFNDRRTAVRTWLDEAGAAGSAPRAPLPSASGYTEPRPPLLSYPMQPPAVLPGQSATLPSPSAAEAPAATPGPSGPAVTQPMVEVVAPSPLNPADAERSAAPKALVQTRQFVGSLSPIHLEGEEPSGIPTQNALFMSAAAGGSPRPLLRRALLAAGIAIVALIAVLGWFFRRPRPTPSTPAAPSAPAPTLVHDGAPRPLSPGHDGAPPGSPPAKTSPAELANPGR
jgi:serine/threonine-protein kinase